MAFAMHMQPSSPFGTPNHQATPTGQSNQQQQQLFFTPQQPRSSNSFRFPGQDPFAFPTVQSNSTPKSVQNAPSVVGGGGGQRHKGPRHSTGSYSRGTDFRPLNSSPLARSSKSTHKHQADEEEDDMYDDDEDDRFSAHQPSSPLSRVSFLPPPTSSTTSATTIAPVWNMGTARSTRRRPKSLGRASDDDDDEVNPSPLVERRRAQYKSLGPSTMPRVGSSTFTRARTRRFPPPTSTMSSGSWSSSPSSSPPIAALFERPRNVDADEDPRRAFLRERFKKRYFARATKAREKAVKARRRRVEGTEDYFAGDDEVNSDVDDDGNRSRRKSKGKGKAVCDDEDMEDDDEEREEEILNDELFSRIVANMNRKTQHAYRVSYAREIGSSFDPDIEDVSRWEDELLAEPIPASSSTTTSSFPSSSSSRTFPPSSSATFSTPSSGTIRPDIGSSPPRAPTEYEYDGAHEIDFADFEDAEIEEYAEEYAARARELELEAQHQQHQQQLNNADDVLLEGLEDIPEDELFGEWNWSESEHEGGVGGDEDEDMDWS